MEEAARDRQGAAAARDAKRSAARLLRYEAHILRNGFAVAFSRWHDRTLLAIVGMLALLWLRDAATRAMPAPDARLVAGGGVLLAWLVVRAVRRRLEHLGAESALAADALDPGGRRLAGAAMAAFPILLAAGLAELAVPEAVPAFAIGLCAGAVSAAAMPLSAPSGFSRLPGLALRPGPLPGWKGRAMVEPAVIAGAVGLILRAALLRSDQAAASAVAIALAMIALAWLIRPDAAVARFLAFAGHGPWRSAALQLAPAAFFLLLALPISAFLAAPRPALLGTLAGLGLLALALMRVWLLRLHGRRGADLILTLGVALLAALATAAPPLALLFGLGMAAGLYRQAAGATWRLD